MNEKIKTSEPQKPGTIIIKETKQKLVDVLNGSGLQLPIIQLLISNIKSEIDHNMEIISRQEEEDYLKQLAAYNEEIPKNK